jgi:hypothetical protein
MLRASAIIMEKVCSAVEIVLSPGVHHKDAPTCGRIHINVIHAHARATDDTQFLGGFDDALCDLRLAADDQGVILADGLTQLVFFETRLHVHVKGRVLAQ